MSYFLQMEGREGGYFWRTAVIFGGARGFATGSAEKLAEIRGKRQIWPFRGHVCAQTDPNGEILTDFSQGHGNGGREGGTTVVVLWNGTSVIFYVR